MSDQIPNSTEQPPEEKDVKSNSPELPLEEEKANLNSPVQSLEEEAVKLKGRDKIRSSLKKPNYVLQNISYLGGLVLSICAIVISILSYYSANKQFKDNANNSKSLFDIQLENEKMINTNLEKIREQSDSLYEIQFKLTNTQIDITERLLTDQINSGSPKIIKKTETLTDKNVLFEGKYAPLLITTIQNTGTRDAYNVDIRPFAVLEDFKIISSGIGFPLSKKILGFEEIGSFMYRPKFENPVTTFYYCYQISYFDKTTLKKNYYTEFIKFFNDRGKDNYIDCNPQEEQELKKVINNYLKDNHLDIFH